MNTTLVALTSLGSIGALSAMILYVVSQKFKVEQNLKVDEIDALLPQANCGGCSYPGCKQFAEAIWAAKSLDGFFCPVGGNAAMEAIGSALGIEVIAQVKKVAVLKCQGTLDAAPSKVDERFISSCVLRHAQSAGSHGCPTGCVRGSDCVLACNFDALIFDEKIGLPVVIYDKCTACNACVKACPRDLFELRTYNEGEMVFVACMNTEKGPVAKKNCSHACIACQKCVKVMNDPTKASMVTNLAVIHDTFKPGEFGKPLKDSCPTEAIVHLSRGASI